MFWYCGWQGSETMVSETVDKVGTSERSIGDCEQLPGQTYHWWFGFKKTTLHSFKIAHKIAEMFSKIFEFLCFHLSAISFYVLVFLMHVKRVM